MPFIPSGSIYNNWINIMIYFPIGFWFYLHSKIKKVLKLDKYIFLNTFYFLAGFYYGDHYHLIQMKLYLLIISNY